MKTATETIGNGISTIYFEDGLLMVTYSRDGSLAPTYYNKLHGEWVAIPYDTWVAEYNQLIENGFN